MQNIRTWMKEARKRTGMTQKQLADLIGTRQDVISKIERGTEPRVRTAKKIAEALKIDWTIFYRD